MIGSMTDPDDISNDFDEPESDDPADWDEESRLEHTRADYTGVDLHDDFQPVDEVELAEEGMLLDDPVALTGGLRRRVSLDPDDVGWDLDEERELDEDEEPE
jgi:hypothetical protein